MADKKTSLRDLLRPTRSYVYMEQNTQEKEIIAFDLANQWSFCPSCNAPIHKPPKGVCPICNTFGIKTIKYPVFLIMVSNNTLEEITKLAQDYPSKFIVIARKP